jgi:RNA polymerase sigma-70 factor (ECF subfamily)
MNWGGTMLVFEEIYSHYYKPVYRYMSRLVKDEAAAEDLAQEALIKVYGGMKDIDEGRGLSPWIFTVARNTFVDYHRKRKHSLEFMDCMEYSGIDTDCPEAILINREKHHKIKEAFCMLSSSYRSALMLKVYRDMSYKEIAARLRINESDVKNLIHRGRKQLQKKYAELYQG